MTAAGYDRLNSNLAQFAQMAAAGFMPARVGIVSSYDPASYLVKVRIMPEDVETGWAPIVGGMVGQGWGVYFGPSVGDQAMISFLHGDARAPVCLGFLASDEDPPPAVPSGEVHLRAVGDAAAIELRQGGVIASRGEWVHMGTLHVSDTLTAAQDVLIGGDAVVNGEVTADGIGLTTHHHAQANDSRGDSEQPTGPALA